MISNSWLTMDYLALSNSSTHSISGCGHGNRIVTWSWRPYAAMDINSWPWSLRCLRSRQLVSQGYTLRSGALWPWKKHIIRKTGSWWQVYTQLPSATTQFQTTSHLSCWNLDIIVDVDPKIKFLALALTLFAAAGEESSLDLELWVKSRSFWLDQIPNSFLEKGNQYQ